MLLSGRAQLFNQTLTEANGVSIHNVRTHYRFRVENSTTRVCTGMWNIIAVGW